LRRELDLHNLTALAAPKIEASRMALGVSDGHVVDERAVRAPKVRNVAAVVPDRSATTGE
jgi:hypothetical protein